MADNNGNTDQLLVRGDLRALKAVLIEEDPSRKAKVEVKLELKARSP